MTRLIVIVAMLLVMGGFMIYSTNRSQTLIATCTQTVTGTVTDSKAHRARKNRSRVTYTTTASYEVNGVSYTCKGSDSGFRAAGNPIEVKYNPADPSQAYCGNGPSFDFTAAYILVAVAAAGGLGVSFLLKKR